MSEPGQPVERSQRHAGKCLIVGMLGRNPLSLGLGCLVPQEVGRGVVGRCVLGKVSVSISWLQQLSGVLVNLLTSY